MCASHRRSHLRVHDIESEDEGEKPLDINGLQQLWADFDSMIEAMRTLPSNQTYMSPEVFKIQARKWAKNFMKLTFDEDVTLYIHIKCWN